MLYNFSHNLGWYLNQTRLYQLRRAKRRLPLDEKWAQETQLRSSDGFGSEPFNPLFLPKFTALIANSGLSITRNFFTLTANIRHDTDDDLIALENHLIDNPNMDNQTAFYQQLGSKVSSGGNAKSVHEYMDLFGQEWSKESIKGKGEKLFSDEVFANQAVSGPCPTLIKRFNLSDFSVYENKGFSPDNNIFLENSPFTQSGDDDLSVIAEEGRLYIQDFSRLDNLKGSDSGAFSSEKRYVFAPFAFYAVTKGENPKLLPIAIQMRQTDRAANAWDPIFVPHMYNAVTSITDSSPAQDGSPETAPEYSWELAKLAVSSASNIYHEFSEHLGLTHLMLEGVALSMARTLPKAHPVHAILNPHLQGTRAINKFARQTLINKGGFIDTYLSATLEDFNSNAARDVHDTNFEEKRPDVALNMRDIDDLPYYPYRDDSRLLWEAISTYVDEFLSIYYTQGSDFQTDRSNELGKFISDLTQDQSTSRGNTIKGMRFGGVDTYEELVNFVSFVIFTASCQHAAVNFPQKDYFANVALCPGTVSRPTPVPGEVNKESFMEFLPPKVQALYQMNLMNILSSYHFTQLGHFTISDFSDYRVWPTINRFKENLRMIEEIIDNRNSQLVDDLKYTYLKPSNIPQSTNI